MDEFEFCILLLACLTPICLSIWLYHERVMKYGRPWLNKERCCSTCGKPFGERVPVEGAVPKNTERP